MRKMLFVFVICAVFVLIILLLYGYYTKSVFISSDVDCSSTNNLKDINYPSFVENVSPAPCSVISDELYYKSIQTDGVGGVYAVIKTKEIFEKNDKPVFDTVKSKIEVFVDSKKTTHVNTKWITQNSSALTKNTKGKTVIRYGGPYVWVYVPIALELGQHTAVIELHKNTGEVVRYNWSFTIIP